MRPGCKPGGYAWHVSTVRRVLSCHEVPPLRAFPLWYLTQATILSLVAFDLRVPTDSPRRGPLVKLATQTAKASYHRREAEGLVAALASRVSLERIGEGLKPLTTSQTPSENSKSATGSADNPAKGACCPIRPNITAR